MTKKVMVTALSAIMVLCMSITAFAGSWQQDATGWWWQRDDGSYPAGGWEWIDDNGNGMAECYYFDPDGYCLLDTVTPDGYTVDANGAWVVDGVIQMQAVSAAAGADTGSSVAVASGPYVANITTVTDNYTSGGTTLLEISYQQVILKDDAPDALKQTVAAWNQSIAGDAASWKNLMIPDVSAGVRYAYEHTQTFNVGLDDGKYLSLSSSCYEYTGGAHGDSSPDNKTFNAQTGQVAVLSSMVSDYQAFGNKVLPYIEAQLNSNYDLFSDANTTIQQEWNNGTIKWYLTDAGLTFTFGPYEIGPHSSGNPEVTYPMSMLVADMDV